MSGGGATSGSKGDTLLVGSSWPQLWERVGDCSGADGGGGGVEVEGGKHGDGGGGEVGNVRVRVKLDGNWYIKDS